MRPAVTSGCKRRAAGVVWWPWLLILMMITSLFLVLHYANHNLAKATECRDQMRRMYAVLGFYEVQNGLLPDLSFYPENPREDEDSLRVVLEAYGLNAEDCVCPKAQPRIKAEGLSYLWNVNLNDQVLSAGRQAEWLLTEIEVMSNQLKGPHFRQYHVMYTDGHVKRTDTVPHEIPGGSWREE
jgi:hypothetical protein